MALPAFIFPFVSGISTAMRIPAIATFISGIILSIFNFFAKFAVKRWALTAAMITVLIGMMTALLASIRVILATIHLAMPESFSAGIAFFIPEVSQVYLSACLSVQFLAWVYSWQFWFLNRMT